MLAFQSNDATFSALALTDLPALLDYCVSLDVVEENSEDEFTSAFNLALLRDRQVAAKQVAELADLITETGLPDFKIVFCHLDGLLGATYLQGDIPWPLMFLDSSRAKTRDELRKTYLHEAAHLMVDDQDHEFRFSAMNNLLRYFAGYSPSQDAYDYRACNWDGMTISDAKALSGAMVQHVVQQRVPAQRAGEAVLILINSYGHVGADSQTIVERFRRALECVDSDN